MRRKNFESTGATVVSVETKIVASEPDQLQAVRAKADLRLLSYDLRSKIVDFKNRALAETTANTNQEQLEQIIAEAGGANQYTPEVAEKILANKQLIAGNAAEQMAVAPSYAQMAYATLAKAEQALGENYGDNLRRAQDSKAGRANETARAAADFKPDALLMGILQREVNGKELPDLKILAEASVADPKLLPACALALDETERAEFIGYLPEADRAKTIKIFDRELSKVLSQDKITTAEVAEREGVKDRLGVNLKSAFEGKEEVGHGLLLEIIDALDNLGGEDSKRLLLEIGLNSLKKERDPIKALTKNAQLARLIKKLFEIDQKLGGNLALKFLARQEVPDSLFKFMANKLVREKYFPAATERYLNDQKNFSWLRKLIAEYPNQFNTVIDTISKLSNYQPTENQEEIFAAIEDLGSLTPIIFKRYHEAGLVGRQDLAKKIKSLKPRFFHNEPIAKILPKQDREILSEMVYLAYKPVGMDCQSVDKFIPKLEDQTEDLAGYNFPAEGYDFTLGGKKKYELKPGEKFDLPKISIWRDLFDAEKLRAWETAESADQKQPAETKEIKNNADLPATQKDLKVLVDVTKGKTEFSPLEIGRLLEPLAQTALARNFLERYPKVDELNVFGFLAELQEIVGVYFKDNFSAELESLLAEETDFVAKELIGVLEKPKRQQTLERLMGGKLEVDWQKIRTYEELSKVLSQYIGEKVISPWRAAIKKDLKKFQVQGGGTATATKADLKAYVSKNVGSFFAKASAGICTAQDIELFNRDDHFHLNIVEQDEKVKGNIQAYIIEDGDGQSLVLRGFNPNSDFMKNISVEDFCEKVLDIGQQFVKDNGFKHLYITEQDGGWHALSNRTEVFDYMRRYLKERTVKKHRLQVASGHHINTIYQVG